MAPLARCSLGIDYMALSKARNGQEQGWQHLLCGLLLSMSKSKINRTHEQPRTRGSVDGKTVWLCFRSGSRSADRQLLWLIPRSAVRAIAP